MTAPLTPPASGFLAVLRLWVLALVLSAALVAAGQRWPQPLVPDGRWVWGLVLGPPLLMALWLLGRWPQASVPASGRGDHREGGESSD
jgi:hypothetical protein